MRRRSTPIEAAVEPVVVCHARAALSRPVAPGAHERAPAACRQLVDAPAATGAARPRARKQPALLEAVQRRIDGSLREIECAAAAPLQLLDDPVAVRRLVGDDREQQEVEVSLEGLGAHGADNYT